MASTPAQPAPAPTRQPAAPRRTPAKRRLAPEDWALAALRAIGEGGLKAVAVEPLAARLGATKGSFYWHFANREAVIAAALELWEREFTEGIIAAMDTQSDPTRRLRDLFAHVIEGAAREPVELALLAATTDPQVAPVVRRVTARRIDYVTGIFEALGHDPASARRRALLGFSAYLGNTQLAHTVPDLLPGDPVARRQYLDDVIDLLIAR